MPSRCWLWIVTVSLFYLGALIAAPAEEQPRPGAAVRPASAPSVPVLLKAAQTALGGESAFARVRSLTVRYTLQWTTNPNSRPRPFAFTMVMPDGMWAQTGRVTHTLKGEAFWQNEDNPAEIRAIAHQNARVDFVLWTLVFLLRTPTVMPLDAEVRGPSAIGTVRGDGLLFRGKDGFRMTLLIDQHTRQPLGFSMPWDNTTTSGRNNEMERTGQLSDYREVGGVRFPHRIDEAFGTDRSRMQVTELLVNPEGVDKLFVKP